MYSLLLIRQCGIIVITIPDLTGGEGFKYLFFSIVVLALGYIVVWGQTRNLIKAKKLLKEKDDALSLVVTKREILEYKNKNITDSLLYAKKIQEALIPSPQFFEKHFRESFLLFKPRDIVSGDFYFVCERGNRTYVMAADCTGHGVPGALMSMIGLQTIDKIIHYYPDISAAEILDYLTVELEAAFHRDRDEYYVIKDGMDISICIIDRDASRLEFSGAFLPLYMIHDDKLSEIKGDKIVIGRKAEDQKYTNHTIRFGPDDIFYLFSDGYADQFGGTENKKFMNRRFRYLLVTIHRYSLKDQGIILEDNIRSWMGSNEQVDDIMVLGFKP